jgi:hypothetical protein
MAMPDAIATTQYARALTAICMKSVSALSA